MKKLLLITSLFFYAALFAAGTATVVRAHPYLTRGLEKESLIGLRFDNSYGGKCSDLTFRFEFTNCSKSDISNIELWRQPFENCYAFYAPKATKIADGITIDDEGYAVVSEMTEWIYPCVGNRTDSDYLWLTAKINPDISTAAEIRVSLDNTTLKLGENEYTVIKASGDTIAPHRVFPYYYKSGAYFRADRVTESSCAPLEDATDERLKSLNDIILINDLEPVYDASSDSFSTTWNTRKNNNGTDRDNTAGVKYVQGLRNDKHSQAMVRIGLTKNDTKMTMNGETAHPLAFAVSTPKYRAQLIAEIVKIMEETDVDGLDVDWEYPGVNSSIFTNAATWERDWHNYGLFLRDLAAVFFDHGWVLSMCTNLGWTMPSDTTMSSNRTKFMGVLHVPDYIDSMAYGQNDHKDRNGNIDYLRPHASPQVMKDAIKAITDCGVPNRRIVVGQAIYAYEVQNPGWNSVVNWLKEAYHDTEANYQQRRWDADLVWMHREVTRADGTKVSTEKETFEGPSSYHAKVAWCREHDMGGAMSWGYYTDVAWEGEDLMSLGRHHAKSLPMIAKKTYPTPEKVGNVYKLKSESDWCWLRDHNDVSAEFDNDITLNHDPLIITQWKGTLDGNGHKLIIPEDVWLCYEDNAALINTLNGTIKNLTIDLYGRVVSRASRWNDTTCDVNANTLTSTDHLVAVLACEARWGANIENVKVIVHNGAEVQGPVMTGGLVAKVEVAGGNTAKITNSTIINDGLIHSIAYNTAEKAIPLEAVPKVGSIAANTVLTGETTKIVIANNLVEAKSEPLFGIRAAGMTASGNALYADGTALNAYLLNCPVGKLDTAKAEFKLSITIDDAGKPVVSVPEGFNGTLKLLGAADLTGPWSENNPDAKFFKAELGL